MQPVSSTAGVINQEPMPERIDAGEYLDALSQINTRRSKMAGRVNAMRGLTGRSQNFSFGPIAGEAELRERMKITDEQLNDAILERQRAAILRGEINNIDEQMAWYQKGGYDPHFAKEARTAAQSILDQRFQERGAEIREAAEKRQIRTQDMSEKRLKIQIDQERRAESDFQRESTKRRRSSLTTSREDLILEWMVREYETRVAEEGADPVKVWDAVKSEGMSHARDKKFIGFEKVGDEYIRKEMHEPSLEAGLVTGVTNLDEKRIFDEFKNEIPRPSVADKEDEDFVTVPAREYFDKYKEGWNVAADDFDTARDYAAKIDAAITADPNIAQENKQAVLVKVLKNLESVEKGVGRPTEPAAPAQLKTQLMYEEMVQVDPFNPQDTERSTPENVWGARTGFLRAFDMMKVSERATIQHLALLEGPMLDDWLFTRLLNMKAMHIGSKHITDPDEPQLVYMRTVIDELNRRLKEDKPNDVERANIELVRKQSLNRYADYWGATTAFADWMYDREAYKKRRVRL